MSDLISRCGAVLDAADLARILAELSRMPTSTVGSWTVGPNRLELRAHDGQQPRRLAMLDIAHGSPHAHAATITSVTVTEAGQAAGLDADAVCDLALATCGLRLLDCDRTNITPPPVFTGRRSTDRAGWDVASPAAAVSLTLSSDLQQALAPAASATPAQAVDATSAGGAVPAAAAASSAPVASAAPIAEDMLNASHAEPTATASAIDLTLTSNEDRELRRLHYLASFGGLTSGPASRYAELRARDRRSSIRPPHDDDLIVMPRQRVGSADFPLQTATGL